MTDALKKHVADYKSDLQRQLSGVVDEKVAKKKRDRCREVWDLSAQITFDKTLDEIEALVKVTGQ